MCMHKTVVVCSIRVHWSLSRTVNAVDVTGTEPRKEVESVSECIIGPMHAV